MGQMVFALVIFLFPLAFSPGPGNMFFAANSARFGFRATIPANIGYHVATWIVTAALGFGLIATLDSAPRLFTGLRLAGSVYIFWIAWKLFRAGALERDETARAATFADGVVLLLLNPKAYVIIALMFTQFLDHSTTETLPAVLLITTIFTVNNMIAFCLWALIGDRIAGVFRRPEKAQTLNMIFGGILAAVATWMLLS